MKRYLVFIVLILAIYSNSMVTYGQIKNATSNVSLIGRIGDSRNFGMAIEGNYAYVGGGCNLYIFNITDNAAPVLTSKLLLTAQIAKIKIKNNKAYIADGAAGLVIVDVSNPQNPHILSTLKSKSITRDLDFSGNYVFISDIFYGFVVVDVSDSQNPVMVYSYSSEAYGEEIKIKGNRLFFCDNYAGLKVFDITNPKNPVLVEKFTACSSVECVSFHKDKVIISNQHYGLYFLSESAPGKHSIVSQIEINGMSRQLTVAGDSIYVSGLYQNVKIVDISNVERPAIVREYGFYKYVNNIELVNNFMYYLNVDSGLEIYDKTKDNDMIFKYVMPSYMREFDFYNNYISIAYEYAGVQIYDIKNPVSPVSISNYDKNITHVNKVINCGNLSFMFNDYIGVYVYDISDVTKPKYLSVLTQKDGSAVTGSYIAKVDSSVYYLVTGENINIYDLSDPKNPQMLGSKACPGGNRIIIQDKYAYISNWTADKQYKLFIYDVSDKLSPLLTGTYSFAYYPYGIELRGNTIYAACCEGGLYLIDVTDKNAPKLKNRIYYGNHNMSYSSIKDNYLYVTDGYNGMLVFDIKDENNITRKGQFYTGNSVYYVKAYGDYIYLSSFDEGLFILKNDFIVSAVEENMDIMVNDLLQNYPNPFNPTTKISFKLQKTEKVCLKIFNILGEELATLVNSEMSAGRHEVEFDGSKFASGRYIYTITTPSYSISKKMILSK